MLLILIAIVVAAAIAALMLLYASDGYSGRHTFTGIFGVILGICTGIVVLIYICAGWDWIAAGTKAKIINREYGTHYTQEEIFYASDVIDTIREIDRKRVEVNGDLMREKSDKHN